MTERIATDCVVAGGGPAGMMLGFLLARAGIRTCVLEKHADFLRDFRGDTVHPSTLAILSELGLSARFDRLKQHRVQQLSIAFGDRLQPFVDFRGLKPFDYLVLVPQWDFLDMLADAGKVYPGFDLRMSTRADALIEADGRVAGVRATAGERTLEIRANLVVACDGRHSTLREAAGFTPIDYGAPMDVLWFRLPRNDDDPKEVFGRAAFGHLLVLLNRDDYWQAAYVVAKGAASELRERPIAVFHEAIARIAPFLAGRAKRIEGWDEVKLLEVTVDRLQRWHRPGLLLIGDAAHAMSPVGGVGINLAIQDAVAAANALAPALANGGVPDERVLAAVQRRREFPTRFTQALQRQIQKRVIAPALSSNAQPDLPKLLQWLLRFRAVRHIPARVLGYGVRREHVRSGEAKRA